MIVPKFYLGTQWIRSFASFCSLSGVIFSDKAKLAVHSQVKLGNDTKSIQFEPVSTSGRAIHLEMDADKFHQQFFEQYQQATLRGNELGIQVNYSGCRGNYQTTHFCGALGPTPNFMVSTDGMVSSCSEIIDPHSPKGQITVYGYYDRPTQRFVFDEQKLQRIRQFSVEDMAHCKTCFARWNCAGDCFARADIAIDEQGNIRGSRESHRCAVNRETTLYDLVRRAAGKDLTLCKNPRLSSQKSV